MSISAALSSQPFLSFCAIVKNESENLARCLASVQPYVDEIIVVDTGSQDDTPEIASQYGAKVGYFEWCDDFAAARNYALSLVTGEWILVLDADEELIVRSADFRETLKSQPEALVYSIVRTEVEPQAGMTPLHMTRLFRNLPEIRYIGRFHEQIQYQNRSFSDSEVKSLDSVRVLHQANSHQQVAAKVVNRNIPILERTRQEEGLSLMLLYSLAGMYGAAGEDEKARDCWEEGLERLVPHLIDGQPPEEFGFIPSLVFTLAGRSLQNQDYETTMLLCQRGLEWCPNYPPLNYIAGMTLINLGFPLGAVAYFENCLKLGKDGSYYTREPFEESFTTTDPACCLGLAYINLKRWSEAVSAFELALTFDENCTAARENLAKIRQSFTE
ncbi:glycosyltransferase [Microcoleus sp. bin38.metabat.b11b12b14.051]|uniref:glycosyltransferase n=1 Tax=Microcoleus sp. bin38.metabat.b11b12b14.051 TaxID=2742709 RepID=UPI0025FE20EB|nr:glycosyltransferase [Microcoleus sp. bin38.metabat.b11b12b14.051]